MLSEYNIVNGSVTLHVLANGPAALRRLAVCVVPGLSETADDWRDLLEFLEPLQAAAVTLRGRGRSSSPEAGYSLAHHASDVAAFVDQTQAESVVLVAFSRSVGYALEYATSSPKKLAALVLLDYPPKHSALPDTWAEAFAESTWRSRKASSVVSLPALQAIAREAEPKDFTPYLSSLRVPTLVVRGGKAGAALSADGAAEYATHLPRCKLAVLSQSTHALWEPSANDLNREIASFAREAAGEA
jgi:pimeloyl-ACP methyl ester carboxylesterase